MIQQQMMRQQLELDAEYDAVRAKVDQAEMYRQQWLKNKRRSERKPPVKF